MIRKALFLTSLLFGIYSFTFSQSNPQNLNELIESLSELDYGDSLYGVTLKKIFPEAKAAQAYDDLGNYAIEAFGHPHYDVISPEERKSVLHEAISYENEIESTTIKGELHLKLAGAYFNLNQYDSAIMEYSAALDRFELNDSLLIADSYFFRGQARDYQGNLIDGMNDYQEAQKIYEALGNEAYVDYVYGGMAILYSKYELFDEAEEIRDILIEKAEKAGENYDLSIQLYNKANDFRKQKKFDDQLLVLQKADSLTPFDERNYYVEAMIKLALSSAYGEQGMIESQEKTFLEAKALAEKAPDLQLSNPTYLKSRALLAKNTGNIRLANELARESLESAKASGNMDHLIRSYELLFETYTEMNQPKDALEALKNLTFYKDSLFTVNKATTFSYYQTLYETEKKERELLAKNLELETVRQRNKTRMRVIGVFAVILIGLGAFIFLWKNYQYQKKQKELQAHFSQELLKNQEAERVRISKDLHDGLGQSLLLIKNKIALTQDDVGTGELLDTAISELRAIARSLHPMQLEKLGLSKAATHLLDQIDNETDIFVSSEIEDLNGVLSKEKELQLYRILQESINNVLKHSEASALRVIFRKTSVGVEMKIEDNGKGFDFSEKLNDFQSLGLKTLKERIASIQGSMKVTSHKGNGTSLSFITYV